MKKTVVLSLVIIIGVLCPVWAQKVKDAKQNLDTLAFTRPQLRLSETLTEAESLSGRIENISDMDRFRSEYGTAWHFLMDERTGRVNLLNGGAIPFIPGPANDLRWDELRRSLLPEPVVHPAAEGRRAGEGLPGQAPEHLQGPAGRTGSRSRGLGAHRRFHLLLALPVGLRRRAGGGRVDLFHDQQREPHPGGHH